MDRPQVVYFIQRAWGSGAEQRGSTVEAYDKLKKILAEIDDDMQKAMGGNRAAGTRIRQSMQDVKEAAQEIRTAILDQRKKEEKPG